MPTELDELIFVDHVGAMKNTFTAKVCEWGDVICSIHSTIAEYGYAERSVGTYHLVIAELGNKEIRSSVAVIVSWSYRAKCGSSGSCGAIRFEPSQSHINAVANHNHTCRVVGGGK